MLKKTLKKIVVLGMLGTLALSVCGCGSKKSDYQSAEFKTQLCGDWVEDDNDAEMSCDTFSSDGSYKHHNWGYDELGTYTIEADGIYVTVKEHDQRKFDDNGYVTDVEIKEENIERCFAYTYEDGVLSLENEVGNKLHRQ